MLEKKLLKGEMLRPPDLIIHNGHVEKKYSKENCQEKKLYCTSRIKNLFKQEICSVFYCKHSQVKKAAELIMHNELDYVIIINKTFR